MVGFHLIDNAKNQRHAHRGTQAWDHADDIAQYNAAQQDQQCPGICDDIQQCGGKINVFLFDDTIRENIRHARPDATDAEIEAACREANCDGFIRKMEKGYDTPTGENGNLLSGGERQRISIARAILKNSPILLLDEATASLDIENELAVKQAIANLLKEKKTVVMIAHTLSIVKNADQILVVADGRIAESGTHDELLTKGGKYAAMWNAEQKISA